MPPRREIRMFEVVVSGWFAASHQLRLPDGSLEPMHGHNWKVEVVVRGPRLDGIGVLVDFTRLQPLVREELGELDHRHLNDLSAFAERNPSAEYVAVHLAERIEARLPRDAGADAETHVFCVSVEEAPGCVARYYPRGGQTL
jgi:6-pyruvoyltetrahydropterin/6-carboxytetrahydropterin synthase